ncbi:pyruvate kinase [Candidatus Magnetoovum chiemensis]|nr:pyruvate kinase [Candidatus Magnetoovum chiemensis]
MQIHATVGPTSRNAENLKALLSENVHAVRINMSHADLADLPVLVGEIKEINPAVLIGADIRGRKLRIGTFKEGEILLQSGDRFSLIPVKEELEGNVKYASVNYPTLCSSAAKGLKILLDDGAISLITQEVLKDEVLCVVENGGVLPQRSGLNIPGHFYNIRGVSDKDLNDLDHISKCAFDLLYLSFVERSDDIVLLRAEQNKRAMSLPIIAKIELSTSVDNIADILTEADGICIARGDLGVETPLAKLPDIQSKIVRASKQAGKPVYLAGEVLFSLINRHTPFRAEVTDVITALKQGVDGFILSDETAKGINPANAVNVLDRLINSYFND